MLARIVAIVFGREFRADFTDAYRLPGENQLSPECSNVVTLEQGAMFVQVTGQPKIPMFAASLH
jgi:hypothetical protein